MADTNGRRVDIVPPPPGRWSELDDVAATHRRLMQDRRVTSTRLGGLRGERERAADQERAQLAKALKEDKAPPKLTKVEKIDRDIVVCEQRLAALEEAIEDSVNDLIAVVDENRDAWSTEVLGTVAEAQQEYAAAIEEVAQASDSLLSEISLLSFLRGFPETESSYRIRGSHVAALRSPNGDPYWLGEVLQALREDAQVEFTATAFRSSRDPISAENQARFEEQRRNELAGRGFLTDAQIREGLTPELIREGL